LTIKAEKKMESEDSGYNYHQIEGFYGTHTRSFNLPDTADVGQISASYTNGVLTVTIPQKPEMAPRSIKVTPGQS
jgi:HSP20 family protein